MKAKKEAYDTAEKHAFAELILLCGDTAFYIVNSQAPGYNRSRRAWKALCEKYEIKSSARRLELKREYSTLFMSENEDPDIFIMNLDFIR